MACCPGRLPQDEQEVHASTSINRILVSERAKARIPQCLLLGTGESGKSTIFKQMRMLHGAGYSEAQLTEARVMIRAAIRKDVAALAEAARSRRILDQVGVDNAAYPSNVQAAIDTIAASADDVPLEQLVDQIELMWADPTVRKVYDLRHLYQLSDGAHYFLDKIGIAAKGDWVPNTEDLIRTRVRTNGAVDQVLNFRNNGDVPWRRWCRRSLCLNVDCRAVTDG
ncbi:hypothetical protein PBRA_001898 [Plasmodiophora brassicae]|uniref:Uncharacterized protein n=1 Tax=Plasmodiophora brassicae TaxID=37360 RepID=A0A0G4J1B0_PLABS|nr:hypothetical protein PBRA_001898 [Plasmodiophora brassicae]